MKISHNYILKTVLAGLFVMPGSLLFAQVETEGIEGVHTEKKSEMIDDTHGKITLNTYVEGEVKVKTQSVPCDIVMVLDFSASMASRIDDLKTSCKSFLEAMRENNPEHRVAIVSYNKCDFTRIGWTSNEDGTVVWPQNPKMSSLNGYDRYGNTDGGNKIKRSANPHRTQQLYDHVKSLNWFIPLNDSLSTEGNVAEYIVNNFESSDCGDDGNSYRGLQVANELLFTKRTNTDNNGTPRPTFVVLFTDGAPGFESGDNLTFSDEHLSICYAINAIGEANQLKSKNTTIFTVGINKDCNPAFDGNITDKYNYTPPYYYLDTAAGAFNAYLNILSSNFKGDPLHTASDIGKGEQAKIGGKTMDYDDIIEARLLIWNKRKSSDKFNFDIQHYLGATQASGMEAAFKAISEEIIEELPSMPLSNETVLKDYIDGRYFRLPDDATPELIEVYTHNCIGGTKVGDTYSDFKFDDIKGAVDRVVVKVETDTESFNNLVTVTGFDYAANWVGQDIGGAWRGKELVVVIPFVIKEGVDVSGTLQTNTGGSGIYVPGEDEPLKPYPIPEIVFWNLNIKRIFLERGESAVYSVYIREEGQPSWPEKPFYIVNLTAQTTGPVERTIVDAPVIQNGVYNEFKVVETGWSWAYESTNTDSEHAQVKKYDPYKKELNFEFTGAHKDITDTDKASYKLNHNESIKTTTFKINK